MKEYLAKMFTQKENRCYLKVKILSNSSKNEIIGIENDRLKIKIQAVREKGKANKEIVQFVAKLLKIPKSKISISSGNTSPLKTLCFTDVPKEILDKLVCSDF